LEIKKRYAQPLAVESGEFPDVSNIEGRMLPFCYEAGLASGHAPDAAQFMSVATETFIKEVLSTVFSRTRSNPPGDSGNAGFGPNNNWIQTHKYRRQLAREEEAFQRGEVIRDKSGLLPVEAKAAAERGPLGMADLRLALEMGDCGLANFPTIVRSVIYDYREGELENWEDYTYVDGRERIVDLEGDVEMGEVNGTTTKGDSLTNGMAHGGDKMDIDNDVWWEGADPADGDFLNSVLDSCLAAG
jgi:transcriptional coactivator HFI1/ADA1